MVFTYHTGQATANTVTNDVYETVNIRRQVTRVVCRNSDFRN